MSCWISFRLGLPRTQGIKWSICRQMCQGVDIAITPKSKMECNVAFLDKNMSSDGKSHVSCLETSRLESSTFKQNTSFNHSIQPQLIEPMLDPEIYYEALAPDITDPQHQTLRRTIDFIIAEYEALKSAVSWMPSSLTVKDMEIMIKILRGEEADTLPIYLSAVFKREVNKLRNKQLRHQKADATNETKEAAREWLAENAISEFSVYDKDDRPIYKLWRNNMFFKMNTSMARRKGSASRLRRAALFDQPFILDFSWQAIMNNRDMRKAAHHVQLLFQANRDASFPFDLWFVNLYSNTLMEHNLQQFLAPLYTQKSHCVNMTERHYLDLFPKERLVYISPLAPRALTEVDRDHIYIVGAMCDRNRLADVSYQRAQIEGISCARLPLIEHLRWHAGGKGTYIFETLSILNQAKLGVPWVEAFAECSLFQKRVDLKGVDSTSS